MDAIYLLIFNCPPNIQTTIFTVSHYIIIYYFPDKSFYTLLFFNYTSIRCIATRPKFIPFACLTTQFIKILNFSKTMKWWSNDRNKNAYNVGFAARKSRLLHNTDDNIVSYNNLSGCTNSATIWTLLSYLSDPLMEAMISLL